MEKFSERIGKTKAKIVQRDSMDGELRNSLWNTLDIFIWSNFNSSDSYLKSDQIMYTFFLFIWRDFLKLPIDTIYSSWDAAVKDFRNKFFLFEWYDVYDFIEFTAINCTRNIVDPKFKNDFILFCNEILERELSAYRFIGDHIVEITSTNEIQEMEIALDNSPITIKSHLDRSLKHLSDKKNPDYRNSIKESISAVEAICKIITNNEKGTLSDALKIIENKSDLKIHTSLKQAYDKIYGWSNDSSGIRHCLTDEDDLSQDEARYFLVVCSAFINYLTIKADNAGIQIF